MQSKCSRQSSDSKSRSHRVSLIDYFRAETELSDVTNNPILPSRIGSPFSNPSQIFKKIRKLCFGKKKRRHQRTTFNLKFVNKNARSSDSVILCRKRLFFLDVVRRIQQFKTVLPVLTESSTRWYAERKIPFVSRL